jgi:hypothetical protein
LLARTSDSAERWESLVPNTYRWSRQYQGEQAKKRTTSVALRGSRNRWWFQLFGLKYFSLWDWWWGIAIAWRTERRNVLHDPVRIVVDDERVAVATLV